MSTTKQKKDLLGRLVAKLEVVCPYADALYSERHARRLVKDNTEVESTAEADAGVKIRAYDGQKFHEVCVQGWQPGLLQNEVQQLAQRLKEHPPEGRTSVLKISKEKLDKEFSTTPIVDPAGVTVKEKVDSIIGVHANVMASSKNFVNCQVSYREEEERKVFVNAYRRLASHWTGCTLTIVPFVQTSDSQTRSDFMSNFANGFEVMRLDEDEVRSFLSRAANLRTARKLKPGQYTAVLSPMVTGLLAHESFGHGMEADTIMHGRARAAEYLGKKIASVKVSICEDASLPSTHGFLFFDDEGVLPKEVPLVERGIVRQPITDAFSATMAKAPRTANGRAESFDHKVYARMTNTFFKPGKEDPLKIVKSVKEGIYIHSGSSGMEDPKGWGVQIAGLVCERIKNGKLTGELYYEAAIGGYLPDILGNIKAIGKDFEIVKDAGFCGKNHKEWVRVSSGGPHLLITGLELS